MGQELVLEIAPVDGEGSRLPDPGVALEHGLDGILEEGLPRFRVLAPADRGEHFGCSGPGVGDAHGGCIADDLPHALAAMLAMDEEALAARRQHADAEAPEVGVADVAGGVARLEGLDAGVGEAEPWHDRVSRLELQPGNGRHRNPSVCNDVREKKRPCINMLAPEVRGWVWIWMGDPARADDTAIPDWWFMDHPDWKLVPGNGGRPIHTRSNYQLIADNLLDLSHVGYVHPDTIGSDSVVEFPVRTERKADRVVMTRLMPDVEPPPFHRMAGGFEGNVDRWMIVEAALPALIDVDVGSAGVGSGVLEGDRLQGIAYHALNAPTPETATTTHFFYAHARLFKTGSAAMDEIYRRDFYRIFMEDVAIVEAQQASLDRNGGADTIDINVDAPGLAMRALVRERIAAEAAAAA